MNSHQKAIGQRGQQLPSARRSFGSKDSEMLSKTKLKSFSTLVSKQSPQAIIKSYQDMPLIKPVLSTDSLDKKHNKVVTTKKCSLTPPLKSFDIPHVSNNKFQSSPVTR